MFDHTMQFETGIGIWPDQVTGVAVPLARLDDQTWYFTETPPPRAFKQDVDFHDWSRVKVPAMLTMQGFNILQDKEYYYKTILDIPKDYENKTILLRFESVYSQSKIYIDGRFVRSHQSCNTVFDADITDFVKAGEQAVLTVAFCDSSAEISILSAYFGVAAGGILRSVWLMARPKARLEYVHVNADALPPYDKGVLRVSAGLNEPEQGYLLRFVLTGPDNANIALSDSTLVLDSCTETDIQVVDKIRAWDAEHPNLYNLTATLEKDNAVLEKTIFKAGFRHITYDGADGADKRKLYVNGKQVKLRGINLHDIRPSTGRAIDRESVWDNVKTLVEHNINYIRTSHYPPPALLLDACDHYGIYVESETGICFQLELPNQEMIDDYLHRFASMVEFNRNHPCVLIWSLGNESAWNKGVTATYRYIKKTDLSRPVKYSWPDTNLDESLKLDVFSIHYVNNKVGYNITHGLCGEDMPFIHDEMGHPPSNNMSELRRDPNIHNFWGSSIKRYWREIYDSDGALGSGVWSARDDFCVLPDVNITRLRVRGSFARVSGALSGCIWDYLGDLKPEAWMVKKAYSPICIDGDEFEPKNGMIALPIYNRFNHASLNEVSLHWRINDKNGVIDALPDIQPAGKDIVMIPIGEAAPGSVLNLRFFDYRSILLDEYNIRAGRKPVVLLKSKSDVPTFETESDRLTVVGEGFEICFDGATGLIRHAARDGEVVLTGGPQLHLLGWPIEDWKLSSLNARQENDRVAVDIAGSYGDISIQYAIGVYGDGCVKMDYILSDYPKMPEIMYMYPESPMGIAELGFAFDIPNSVNAISWERNGIWNAYPDDHIGRLIGTAPRERPGFRENPDKLGVKPKWSWKDRMRRFELFRDGEDIDGLSTMDFRATKEHFTNLKLDYLGLKNSLYACSDGSQAARIEYARGSDPVVHAGEGNVILNGPWKIAALLGYNGREYSVDVAGSYAELTFNGTGVKVFGPRRPGLGCIQLGVDGRVVGEVVQGLPDTVKSTNSVLLSVNGLPYGKHTARVTFPWTHGYSIAFSAFEILNAVNRPINARLLINSGWNYPILGWGNFVRDPVWFNDHDRGCVKIKI